MTRLKGAVFDPLISGPDNAVWWTEYLLRHGEARHLRSPAVGISSFTYYLLDVFCFVLVSLTISLILSFLTIRAIVRRWRTGFWRSRGLDTARKFKAL